ncbi:MAG: hypothetical protein KDA66_17555, partial [Planctomycetaceae bacterium]|nr:hypothetical protein [Planctomycetaceae bacterium]
VGITWGKTLFSIVEELAKASPPDGFSRKMRFIPLCGEATDFSVAEHSATSLSARLNYWASPANGQPDPDQFLALTATPARLSSKLESPDIDVIRNFIRLSRSYALIFGDEHGEHELLTSRTEPLAKIVDTILTSAGSIYRDRDDVFIRDLRKVEFDREDVSDLELAERVTNHIIGDVGGYFLPRRWPNRDESAKVADDINSRWTGVKLEHLELCAARARGTARPGVILPACGPEKSEIIIEAVRLGIINILIIDDRLADEILRIAKRDGWLDVEV